MTILNLIKTWQTLLEIEVIVGCVTLSCSRIYGIIFEVLLLYDCVIEFRIFRGQVRLSRSYCVMDECDETPRCGQEESFREKVGSS